MKSVLITGGPGQDAFYLTKLISARDDVSRIVVLFRSHHLPNHWYSLISPKTTFQTGIDLTDKTVFQNQINISTYDVIFNMAAMSSVGDSFNNPMAYISNNVNSHLNLLEAVREGGNKNTRIYYPGSSEECYNTGDIKSPYGISKATVRQFNKLYYNLYGIQVFHSFHYNHVSPYQSDKFLFGKVTKYVANKNKNSSIPKLKLGYLEDSRSYMHAEDSMNGAITVAFNAPYVGTYSVTDLSNITARELVKQAFEIRGMNYLDHIEEDPALRRIGPSNLDILTDNRKLKELGWAPKWKFKDILEESINYYERIHNT